MLDLKRGFLKVEALIALLALSVHSRSGIHKAQRSREILQANFCTHCFGGIFIFRREREILEVKNLEANIGSVIMN